MATKPKRYDLKAADRKRNLLVQVGLAAAVVVFAVALVLYIVMSHQKKVAPGQDKAIQVASSKLITKPGTNEPKAVLSLYEDFLCPACANFENNFGSTVNNLIDSGAVRADYHLVAILDRPQNQNYSSRAGAAAYCVADESIDAFRRFHAALYSPQIQPKEDATSFPDNNRLTELAREAGAGGTVPDCINSGKYLALVKGMASAGKVTATPTIRINGEDYNPTTPQDMVNKIEGIVGTVPGLTVGGPAPAAS